jgi:hypothetical protein
MLKLKSKLFLAIAISSLLLFNADAALNAFIGQDIASKDLTISNKKKHNEEVIWVIDQPLSPMINGTFTPESKEYKIVYKKEKREKYKFYPKKKQKIDIVNNHHGAGGGSHTPSSSQIGRIARVMSGTLLYGEIKEPRKSSYF